MSIWLEVTIDQTCKAFYIMAMALILTIAQQKGGAGKTTLAAHLAIMARKLGLRVGAIDIDPQGSLTQWHNIRKEHLDDPLLECTAVPGWRMASELDLMRRRMDLVIIDSPPHAQTEAKIAVRGAGLVLTPVQPSPMDVWATSATLKLTQAEQKPLLLVLNRVSARANLTEDMQAAIRALGAPVANQGLGARTGFASSMLQGLTVVETEPTGIAAQEVAELFKEIRAATDPAGAPVFPGG